MAINNVSVWRLKGALNNLEGIKNNSSKLADLQDDMSPFWGIAWDSVTKNKINDALCTLTACYNIINDTIAAGKTMAENIDQYQKLTDDNDYNNKQITYYRKKITNKERTRTSSNRASVNADISRYEQQINNYQSKINSNNTKIKNLENTINQSI